MKRSSPLLFLLSSFGIPLTLLLFAACEIDSGSEVTRNVSLNVAGSYQNDGGIPSAQTGQTISRLSITQTGDQLFAIDNLGARWTGNIGRIESNLATITLQGMTSTGAEVVISGTITINDTTGILFGNWIEPTLRSDANATATVASIITPTPLPTNTAEPTTTPIPTVTVVP
ncbi:hypothetical protein P3T73_05265 [Kiritimatiellota bacterium B12222]|nr:hypothetical protein P3T73_05265 [Kiritimatiellota bacterium B12222]